MDAQQFTLQILERDAHVHGPAEWTAVRRSRSRCVRTQHLLLGRFRGNLDAGEKTPVFERPPKTERPIDTPDEARQPEEAAINPEKVLRVWNFTPGRGDEPDVLYAGVELATLFKSTDCVQTWEINEALYNHPHRADWFPGAGGHCLHTIVPHPLDHDRMWVAISAGGCYYTDDGGQSWSPGNKNVRADFLPGKLPEYGQCVHKMTLLPSHPDRL